MTAELKAAIRLTNILLAQISGSTVDIANNALMEALCAALIATSEDRPEFDGIVTSLPRLFAERADANWESVRARYVSGGSLQ